jgi:YD repeat-containing protein
VIWTSYRYDPLRQLTAVVDDRGNTTTAAYDNFGRGTVTDSPDSGRTQTVYDLAGNPIRKITAKLAATSQAISYDYDFNRVAAIRYPIFTADNADRTTTGISSMCLPCVTPTGNVTSVPSQVDPAFQSWYLTHMSFRPSVLQSQILPFQNQGLSHTTTPNAGSLTPSFQLPEPTLQWKPAPIRLLDQKLRLGQ